MTGPQSTVRRSRRIECGSTPALACVSWSRTKPCETRRERRRDTAAAALAGAVAMRATSPTAEPRRSPPFRLAGGRMSES